MEPARARQVEDIGHRLAKAQRTGDAEALDTLLADQFKLVGPLGFVIDKQAWLDQFRRGALAMRSVELSDVEVRDFGDVAIAIGRQTQEAEYRGRPAAQGQFRVTQISLRRDGDWVLAGLHFSPITQGA